MKYTGKLSKSIPRTRLGLLASETDYLAEATRVVNLRLEKIPDLCAAHGVAYGQWLALALALAEENVPGFRATEPAGRPTEWGDYWKAEFKLTVDDMCKANPGMPVTQAIARVCRIASWVEKTKGMKVSALSKHYYKADPRMVAVMTKAHAYDSIVRED